MHTILLMSALHQLVCCCGCVFFIVVGITLYCTQKPKPRKPLTAKQLNELVQKGYFDKKRKSQLN